MMPVTQYNIKDFFRLTAISVAFVVLSGFIQGFGVIFLFLSVVPQITFLRVKKYSYAAWSWLLVCAAIGLLRSWNFILLYLFMFVFYSIWYSVILKWESKPYSKVLNASMCWIVLLIFWGIFNKIVLNVNVLENIIKDIKIVGALTIGKYYDFGLPQAQVDLIEKSMKNIIVFFKKSFIGCCFTAGVIGSWAVYHSIGKMMPVKPLPSVKMFRLPEKYIWFLIGAGFFYIMGIKLSEYNVLAIMGINMGVVLLCGYFLSGLGLSVALMTNLNISGLLRFIILFFFFLFLRGIYIFIVIGIADVWFNFRKKWYSS
ncbi:DUF2232 domain-containing protein [Elusimicrobiota bacterium]